MGGNAVPTHDTIPLQAVQTATRTVELSWQATGTEFEVCRRYVDQMEAVVVGTSAAGAWTDHQHRSVCGDTVYYQVRCGMDTGFAALMVEDMDATALPERGVVTVDSASQRIVLRWQASADTDILGYLICEGTPNIGIDSVFGRQNTSYTYQLGTSLEIHNFSLSAFDSCHRTSSLTDVCRNIVLTIDGEPCSRRLSASWNLYNNMPGGVGEYQLWVSEDDDPFVLTESSVGAMAEATVLVSESCMRVRAFVKAISSDRTLTSMSNIVEYTFSTTERPAYLYMRKISALGDDGPLMLLAQTDPSYPGETYTVYRGHGPSTMSAVGRCTPSADGTLQWLDETAHPGEEVYYYAVGVLDGCGRNEVLSNVACSILPVLTSDATEIVLDWNSYSGWEGTTSYEVMTSPLNGDDWQPIGVVSQSNSEPMQMVYDFVSLPTDGAAKYKIIAKEGDDSRYARGDTLQSVVVFNRPYTDIWVPNAFTPDESINSSFRPLSGYVSEEGYSFMIFNRSGLVVFSTNDPAVAWDGTSGGHRMPMGSYTYKITYNQNDGSRQQKIGTVLLIR